MRLRALTLATVLPVAMIGTVAAAPTASDCRDLDGESQICRTPTWLQCDNELPLLQVPTNDGNAKLSYDEPTNSWTAGEPGCGEYDETIFGETSQDGPTWSFDIVGEVEGNLDSMTVELYNLDLGSGRATDVILQTRLTIDNKSAFGVEEGLNVAQQPYTSPLRLHIPVTPESVNNGVTNVYRFTVTGLAEAIGTVSTEKPDKRRRVMVTIDLSTDDLEYFGINPWVWGASETPSGIIFNPLEGEPTGTVVEAIAPE